MKIVQTFTAIDFETTGNVKGYPNLPWQLGVVSLRGGKIDLAAPLIDTYLNVPMTHPFASIVPGDYQLHREVLAEAPTFSSLWQHLNQLLSVSIPVAHNISTERTLLARLAPMTHYPQWVDTLTLMRRVYPNLSSYALENLIPMLGLLPRLTELVPGRSPHNAFYDAVACGLLLEHILALPAWNDAELEDLL
ncbi:MAG: exonuclease domain-containing protein [Kiritimatiellia bacterium]